MTALTLAELAGQSLGESTVRYRDTDTMLYALAVGAAPEDLDLVYERDLRALPTMACGFGLWAVEATGRLGAYDPHRSLHASQTLVVHQPLPVAGEIVMSAQVEAAWDKGEGKASVVEIEVTSDYFTAGYSIFVPGTGGWGGERGPSSPRGEAPAYISFGEVETTTSQAVLYRLTGDRHPIHIDPAVARANGFDRPILHGLCTLGAAAREAAVLSDAHPADLTRLEARLAAPVLPGDTVRVGVTATDREGHVSFGASVEDSAVISAGTATFGSR